MNMFRKTKKRWTATFSLDEITKSLADHGVNVGQVKDIRINQRGPSGRVTEFIIIGTDGQTSMHGADFRLAVGVERMMSTLVDQDGLTVDGQTVTFRGMGFGHGVGMSQWDAYKMAKRRPKSGRDRDSFLPQCQPAKALEVRSA